MYAVVVDDSNNCTYENSSERKRKWLELIPETTDFKDIVAYERPSNVEFQRNLQTIYYGAPGTGKSNTIKREVDEKGKTNFRVTFHPDSDYSTFVGVYKPTMKPKAVRDMSGNIALDKNKTEIFERNISYEFVPQAFTKAYTAAWNTTEDVYLIIEEINRGNCAQIFGDLFQLLDRRSDGFSEYPVDADSDLAEHIRKELVNSQRTDFPEGVKEGKKLVLPSNLYIWATMNTSDQSSKPSTRRCSPSPIARTSSWDTSSQRPRTTSSMQKRW